MKHYDLRAKKYRLLVLEKRSVPGLCTDLSHMILYVHSWNMSVGERKQ